MAIWQMVLYVAAAFVALRSLASLMSPDRKNPVRRFLKRNRARMHRAAATNADFKPKRTRSAA